MEKSESQENSNPVRATGVVRIVRRAQTFQLDLPVPCIERTCITCGEEVNLTLEQAKRIPPDSTECADCFQNLIREGFEELQRRGIILSTVTRSSKLL